jgi:membrane protease YdiL (CAAX protease family)
MDNQTNSRLGFSWQLFWILFGAAVFGILASVPMGIELFRPVLAKTPLPLPLPVIILLGAVQNLALLALFVGLGVLLSRKLGFEIPLIQSWLDGDLKSAKVWEAVRLGVLCGVILGLILVPSIWLLSKYFPHLPFATAGKISLWKRFLICFYGGFYEEVFTRLFLLSFIAWLLNRGWRGGALRAGPFWIANVLVALLFGLGHLPAVSLLMPITPELVAAALMLNGLAAILFGWLYRIKGLEVAMVAHFTTDAMIYVIGPLFL